MTRVRLIFNAGSSSLKFAVFQGQAGRPDRLLSGSVDNIGSRRAALHFRASSRQSGRPQRITARDHKAAAGIVLSQIKKMLPDAEAIAVGHRVVHGGPDFTAPQRITPKLLSALRSMRAFDPEHLPAEIALIEDLQRRFPKIPQVACFDTAFHRDLPRIAQLLPLPRRFADEGVRRYGFHGLSYEFLLSELWRLKEPSATKGRMILAHLGNGASLAAIRDGRPFDTTMGFTPAAGLVMGTRTGDLDPGLVLYLAQAKKMSAARFNRLVNHESGLLGISGTTSDMRALLASEKEDGRAAEAIALFCYQARKWIGSFAAAMGGLDLLVFTGGIGEHCPSIRARICDGLGFLGVHLSAWRNTANAEIVSTKSSDVLVRVMATDEELTIARHVDAVTRSRRGRALAL